MSEGASGGGGVGGAPTHSAGAVRGPQGEAVLLLKVQLQLRQQPSAGRPGKQPRGRAEQAPAEQAPPLPQPVPLPGLPPPPSSPLSSPGLEAPPTSLLLLPPDDPPPPVVVLHLLQRLESTQPSPSLAATR